MIPMFAKIISVGTVNNGNVYSRGLLGYSADSGTSWTAMSSCDMAFGEGQSPPASPWYEQSTASNTDWTVYTPIQRYQTFTPVTAHTCNTVQFQLWKVGSPSFTVTIALYRTDGSHKPTGSALASTTFAASSLTTTATWQQYVFATGYPLQAGTEYALVLSGNGGSSSYVGVRVNNGNVYSRGLLGYSADSGTSWTAMSSCDMAFGEGYQA